jgi:hypothetical protein
MVSASAALSQFGCTLDNKVRRTQENRKHFDTLGVDYDVATSLAGVPFDCGMTSEYSAAFFSSTGALVDRHRRFWGLLVDRHRRFWGLPRGDHVHNRQQVLTT